MLDGNHEYYKIFTSLHFDYVCVDCANYNRVGLAYDVANDCQNKSLNYVFSDFNQSAIFVVVPVIRAIKVMIMMLMMLMLMIIIMLYHVYKIFTEKHAHYI